MTVDELTAFFAEVFPQAVKTGLRILQADGESARCRLVVSDEHLRPGGTVSGPSMVTVADAAAYAAILSRLGPVALAVTTSLHIDFLRRPGATDLLADVELLKVGKQLVVARATIYSDGTPDPVAQASITYALPPTTT